MSLTGHARVNERNPQAHAICDRCGFRYNLVDLIWQFDWRGPKMQNLRVLVCQSCLDQPQQNGQRTIILPPDPVPVQYARPEMYVPDDNPLSALGARANRAMWNYGNQIGTMTNAGGVPAAFDGNPVKPSQLSAAAFTIRSSFQNYVGINWAGNPNAVVPASLAGPVLAHTLSSYTLVAPTDLGFGSTSYVIQGANIPGSWTAWTTLASGDCDGTPGETISGEVTGGTRYQFHRAAFYGSTSASQIVVALVGFSVADGSSI